MPSKNKARGNRFEREIVRIAHSHDIKSERAYASNGKALGLAESADGYFIQKSDNFKWVWNAKKRKSIAPYIFPSEGCHIQIIGEDRGKPHVVIQLDDFLELLK